MQTKHVGFIHFLVYTQMKALKRYLFIYLNFQFFKSTLFVETVIPTIRLQHKQNKTNQMNI